VTPPRVGVVATASAQGWAELPLLVHRVCGALACVARVTLLLVGETARRPGRDGAVEVLTFAGRSPRTGADLALRRACFGPDPVSDGGVACACTAALRRSLAADLPVGAQEALLRSAGGESPELFAHLASLPYDVIVFAGCATASTYWGLQAVGGRRPMVLLAGAVDDPPLWMAAVGDVLDGVDAVLVTSDYEADLLARRAPSLEPARVHDVGFVVEVAELSVRTPPFGFDGRATVVVAGDWNESLRGHDRVVAWATRLEHDLDGRATVRFVGPGVQRLPAWSRAQFASAHVDAWRWMARAVAVIDPEPQRILGRTVLESLLFATPVVVPADGGASRHHAEAGNAGLWYRSYAELRACVEALLQDGVASTMGSQGRTYARGRVCDTDRFVRRVGDAVLGATGVDATHGATEGAATR